MALGRRKAKLQDLFGAADQLPKSPGQLFYAKLNQLLAEARFDHWVEERCAPFFKVYFRIVRRFEGIASQRGIAWRRSEIRSLGESSAPCQRIGSDHSLMTNMHKRLRSSWN
jgi:hypothetical protein